MITSVPLALVISVLVAGVYSGGLYLKSALEPTYLRWVLFSSRFVLIFILSYLLFSPLIRFIRNSTEKPIMVIAIDDSQSMLQTKKDSASTYAFLDQLDKLMKKEEDRFTVHYEYLSGGSSLAYQKKAFSFPTTNLGEFLRRLDEKYENQPHAGIWLYSDGVYTEGRRPSTYSYAFPIHVIAHGDTIQKKDLILKQIIHNPTVFGKNATPLSVDIQANGFLNKQLTVTILNEGKLIASRKLTAPSQNYLERLSFIVEPGKTKTKLAHYTIQIEPQADEFTLKNNVKDTYIQVVDEKKTILLYAATPHPDIKALKAALSADESYEVEISIRSFQQKPKKSTYALIILHQLPTRLFDLPPTLLQSATSLFYIITPSTDIQHLALPFQLPASSSYSEVTPLYYSSFKHFSIDQSHQELIQDYPPFLIRSGVYAFSPAFKPILIQNKSALLTPLLGIYEQTDAKTGFLFGEGIWKWRLAEYEKTQHTYAFDELIQKTIQYLLTDTKKTSLHVYPTQSTFAEHESVRLETELYTPLGEPLTGKKIELDITDPNGKKTNYTYINSSTPFELGSLPPGVYHYEAQIREGTTIEKSHGIWTIQHLAIESLRTEADFETLRSIAATTGGSFFTESQLDVLEKKLHSLSFEHVSSPIEQTTALIEWRWIFFLMALLATMEWSLRKWHGYK